VQAKAQLGSGEGLMGADEGVWRDEGEKVKDLLGEGKGPYSFEGFGN
jgi:hypothetical protein